MSRRVSAGLGRRYLQLWGANTGSALGDGLVLVAFPLLALTLTRNPVAVAGIAIASQLPAVLLAPLGGALVDRVDRRRLAVGIEISRLLVFAAFGAMVAAGQDSLPLIYAVVLALGFGELVVLACTTAAVPDLVSDDQLDSANSRLAAGEMSSRELAGQGIGGALFAVAKALPFIANAASFAVSAALLGRSLPAGRASADTGSSLRTDISEGFRWFVHHRQLMALASILATLALCQGAVTAVFVLYATGPLHLHGEGYGLLLAAAAGCAIMASIGAGRVIAHLGGFGAVALGGALAGGAYALLGAETTVPAALAAIALQNIGVAVCNIASMSMRQRMTPRELFGRVATTFRMIILGAAMLGALAGGVMAELRGLRMTFVASGALELLVIVAVAHAWHGARTPRVVPQPIADLTTLSHQATPAAAAVAAMVSTGAPAAR